jgi:hypothetical protein
MIRIIILLLTFLSAFLLFVIQPMFAKYLLPYFGGTSAVWTISIFFYSAVLLLGYVYAAQLWSWPKRAALYVHGSLLVLASGVLIGRWADGSALMVEPVVVGAPAFSVLLTLLSALGVFVVVLASTSIITQYLYATWTEREPYVLYGLSNAGSILGLAAYPFWFERAMHLEAQLYWWAGGFLLFSILLLCTWWYVQSKQAAAAKEVSRAGVLLDQKGKIVFLAAIPTFLLASLTEYISMGIASFPLLWIGPLLLYLLSFIAAFNDRKMPLPGMTIGLLLLLSQLVLFVSLPAMATNVMYYWIGLPYVLMAFFVTCAYFHRRVYRLRPSVADLGPFYVFVTLGGAIGSGLVGLILPMLVDVQIELFVVITGIAVYAYFRYIPRLRSSLSTLLYLLVRVMVPAAALLFVASVYSAHDSAEYSERNFYGTVTLHDGEVSLDEIMLPIRSMVSGRTVHGIQALDPAYAERATMYYGEGSGVEIAITTQFERGMSPRVNAIGLGAGVVSAYCDQVDYLQYIEINPAVIDLAEQHFTYLAMCDDKTEILIGDGRKMLEDQRDLTEPFDVVVVDAFSDDAIPAHLLTLEAFEQAYLPVLAADGILAFHISNKYLDLTKPIAGAANQLGMETVLVVNDPVDGGGLVAPSVWVLVANEQTAVSREVRR